MRFPIKVPKGYKMASIKPSQRKCILVTDHREINGALPHLDRLIGEMADKYKCNLTHRVENNNPIGDYVFYVDGHLAMIVERKTWPDLSVSIKDGRMNKQHDNMNILAGKTGAKICYILEGKTYNKHPETFICSIPYKNLYAKMRHLSHRGIPYHITEDGEDTANLLALMGKDLLDLYNKKDIIEPSTLLEEDEKKRLAILIQQIYEEIPKMKDNNVLRGIECYYSDKGCGYDVETHKIETIEITPEQVRKNMWTSIPGVSEKVAHIIDSRLHISDFFCEDIEKLRETMNDLKYDTGRKVPKNTITKILNSRSVSTQMAVLSAIPGISNSRANVIISAHEFDALIKMDKQELSDLKIGGRRLGHKCAERILSYIKK